MRILPPALAAILIASCASTAAVTPVPVIQGSGDASPLEDQQVTVEGTVTGDFQADDDESRNLGGFFLQGESDGDDAPSDGLFVFAGNSPVRSRAPA
jgi:predicted extracellular nuclease